MPNVLGSLLIRLVLKMNYLCMRVCVYERAPDSCSAGPMFQKYAAVLRGGQQHQQEKGSIKYVTTIFCIVSGIIKLSKLMKLPPDR